MKLSPEQVRRFWREWPKSCQAMGWTRERGLTAAQIDAHRKEFLARCGFTSLTLVDRVDGFTKVLKELLVLQGTDLQAACEADDGSINKARTIRYHLLNELVPCLELYIPDVREYMTSILEDNRRWWKLDRPTRDITMMDLNAIQLEKFRYTLSARLNDKRKTAGDTIHDMKIKAGVRCVCAPCERARMFAAPAPTEVPKEDLAGNPF